MVLIQLIVKYITTHTAVDHIYSDIILHPSKKIINLK